MLKTKLQLFLVAVVLVAAGLGLTGCRRQETRATPTPPVKQLLPVGGGGNSPLPTPGPDTSPVKP